MSVAPLPSPTAAAPTAWRPRAWWAPALVLGLLLGTVYHRTLLRLVEVWRSNDSYSHGPLVPLVSLALVWWMGRRRFAALPLRPDARGLLLVALACLLQVAALRAAVFALEGYSLVLMAFALALTFLGVARTRVLALPLGYLVFMLPFPPVVVNRLSFALKEITVLASTHLAEALGVMVQRSGMSLYLAGGELRVENPCSGLRSLIALLATGALFAALQPGGPLRRLGVLLAAVPMAMLGNILRITLLLVVGHYVGVKQATGRFHDVTGVLLYVVALAGMLAARRLLMPPAGEARA